jgi:hypothetical protein
MIKEVFIASIMVLWITFFAHLVLDHGALDWLLM